MADPTPKFYQRQLTMLMKGDNTRLNNICSMPVLEAVFRFDIKLTYGEKQ